MMLAHTKCKAGSDGEPRDPRLAITALQPATAATRQQQQVMAILRSSR